MVRSRIKSSLIFGIGTSLIYTFLWYVIFSNDMDIVSTAVIFLSMFIATSTLYYIWIYINGR